MKRLPPLTAVEAFVQAARLGSVKAAAEALALSSPALTRRIQALERHVGRPLFERVPALLGSRFARVEAVETGMEKYIAHDLYYPWYQLKRGSALAWYQSGGSATDAVAADEVKAHMKRFGVWRVSGAKAKRRPRQAAAVQSGEGK